MRILQLTPGTGNFHCGSCLHDLSLTRALRARGHDALMVPLYLPFVTDVSAADPDVPVFLGGISVFLAQKFSRGRRLPNWLDRFLSSPGLLRMASRLVGMTTATQLGESTISMLMGESGGQAGEMERLIEWLRGRQRPDVICLSNSLLVGLARRLKEELRAPVVCSLQGEDAFLDGLPEPYREQAWDLLAERCVDIDRFIAVSHYFADRMRQRLDLTSERVSVVHPGVDTKEFTPAPSPPTSPSIGFLARMQPCKGLGILMEAFILLRQRNVVPGLRLRIAGAQTGSDVHFVKGLQLRLAERGLGDQADFIPNLTIAGKRDFLRGLTVFSVPAAYGEAFGLYLLEALASGVPVVQPRSGAFPEVLALTGGGVLCEPDDPKALADAIEPLLRDPGYARALGAVGRKNVMAKFSVETMAEKTERILSR